MKHHKKVRPHDRSHQWTPRPPLVQVDLPKEVVLAAAEYARTSGRVQVTGAKMFQELKEQANELGLEGFQMWFDVEFPYIYHRFQYR